MSTSTDGLGLRVDEEVNNLANVVAQYAETAGELPGVLVVFTSFVDLGGGGPAYYVPIHNTTLGTGLPEIDQRERYGSHSIIGVANLKQPERHGGRLMTLLLHELGHMHLAYADLEVQTSSGPVSILGRQKAHWHAALHTEGSYLGGHAFRGQGEGRFVVIARDATYSAFDRHLLGLSPLSAVPEPFFVAHARTESGAPIPADAQLPVGQIVLGTRVPLSLSAIEAGLGARRPLFPEAPRTLRAAFVLLTAPGESALLPEVRAQAERLEALRLQLEIEFTRATSGAGALDTRAGRPVSESSSDGGPIDAPVEDGCQCETGPREDGPFGLDLFAWLLVVVAIRWTTRSRGGGWFVGWTYGFRRRCHERSCGRSRGCGVRPCRATRRLPR